MKNISLKDSELFLNPGDGSELIKVITSRDAIENLGMTRGEFFHHGTTKGTFDVYKRGDIVYADYNQVLNHLRTKKKDAEQTSA